MPRTFGRNQLHVSQVEGWCEVDRPLLEVAPAPSDDVDARIAAYVAERIPDGATIQIGIGATPNAILAALAGPPRPRHAHRAAVGRRRRPRRGRRRQRRPQAPQPHEDRRHVRPRHRPAAPLPRRQPGPRAVAGQLRQRSPRDRHRAGLRVDQLDAHASTSSASAPPRRSPATTTPPAAARPTSPAARCTPPVGRASSSCTRRPTTATSPRSAPTLAAGDVVTTIKNTVDKVVTEWGVAELRGRSIRERATALIAIAHPDHRDHLRHSAHHLGYL